MTEFSKLDFKVIKKDKKSKARVGEIITSHGIVHTPSFVAVGTQATVKSLTPQDLKEIGVEVLFGNTYHLHLRPGEDVIKKFGGLGKFMEWDGVTMTDSGGFQVFSLAKNSARRSGHLAHVARPARKTQYSIKDKNHSLSERRQQAQFLLEENSGSSFSCLANGQPFTASNMNYPTLVKITDDGVEFRSHLDGSKHVFTPEKSIEIQKKLGADIILAFDECTPHPSTREYTKEAMVRTHGWAVRCLDANSKCHAELVSASRSSGEKILKQVQNDKENPPSSRLRRGKQALFGIVHGGIYKDLRQESAKFISSLDFDGIAIGGVSVGESKKQMRDVLNWIWAFLPEDKPRHLLGIGEIDDIFAAVENGMDTFDCVIPTRLGRTGFILVSPLEGNLKNRFRIDINKSIFAKDQKPLAKNCRCFVCQNPALHRSGAGFTRGYLHHLFHSRELLAYRLATYHNLYFATNLVREIREAILEERFEKLKKKWLGETNLTSYRML